jgi:murein DD-endopeptidase MepM/ murein hydrolase activator NlpD
MKFLPMLIGLCCGCASNLLAGIELRLPTENEHLYANEPEKFYMHVDRYFEGKKTQPWEGGSFGMVRNAIRHEGQVIMTKFHEGIDVAPLRRDAAAKPLDPVRSISPGTVVHISPLAGRSNYGKYVVVRHDWEGAAVFSLYAHLAEIHCKPGDTVTTESVLGILGSTGVGLNRERAHLHLELTMMMSQRYEDWHKVGGGGVNYQGLYNGMNLCGTDVARFFLEHRANPERKFSEFVTSTPVYFKVLVPCQGVPDFVKRHPWIATAPGESATSWEISFSATGQPVRFEPGNRPVQAPVITSVQASGIPHRYLTRNLVSGMREQATLTNGGRKMISLLMDDFPPVKP